MSAAAPFSRSTGKRQRIFQYVSLLPLQITLVVMLSSTFAVSATTAGAVEYAKPISSLLNSTGKAIDMEVPLTTNGKELGDIAIRINPDDTLLINRSAIMSMLATLLDGKSREDLAAIPSKGYFIALTDVEAAGFDIRFDRSLQELQFKPRVVQLATTDISLGKQRRAPLSSTLAEPARTSGYVNLYASLDHQWETSYPAHEGGDTSGRLEMNSAVRIGQFVFENSGVLTGTVDVNVCPTQAICTYQHTPGFKRQMSRLVYDMPAERIRSELGDVEPLGIGFQQSPELLGFSFEKSSRKLTPGDTLEPAGGGSFTINQPSKVEIIVNGIVQQQLRLDPGRYNLRDLQLATGANNIDVVITNDAGLQRTVRFTAFFDASLLARGKSEWGLTGGLPSYLRDESRDYLPDLYMASGYFRYGIYDGVTAEGDIQANKYVAMAGTGALVDTSIGLVNLRTAMSAGQPGIGAAFGLDWSVVNFAGLLAASGESFRFSSEYRSPHFHSPGDINTADTGILFPEWNYWLNLSATWSAPVSNETTMALSARYHFVNNAEFGQSIYDWNTDRYGADVTFSRPLTRSLSGSLTIGVSNETFLATLERVRDPSPEFRIGVRLFDRPDDFTSVTAGYDSIDTQTDVSAYRSQGNGLGRWDTSVYVQHSDYNAQASVSASAGYYGNRGQVRIIQNSGFEGISYSNFDVEPGPERTSLQVGTAIAFADGKIAIGAPITGDAFAIVYPHPSIENNDITVGDNDNIKAIADQWGPALVTSLPAYAPFTIPVDADNLPAGYSLGAAAFDTFAPFKAGYALEVGSDYSVSAYGTLVFANGEPVSLVSGVARSFDHPEKTVTIFTNAAGRFGADGLAPGGWLIEMQTDGTPTTFVLDVPPGTKGLFKAGTLHPK
ncbi:fimbrial biogenesis outer membrane usher protein [Hyphomicrobium sp. DY-1]|uniref:fimbrial biogenesis outer membrane usher protein n=1 Tax=Hyphomicrobium sp. DY-1 TaxID=3075650 RepID=UPI0039C44287